MTTSKLYIDRKGNYYLIDSDGNPVRLTPVKSVTPSRRSRDIGDYTGCGFDAAYDRIMADNWSSVSRYAAIADRIPHDDSASYRMWDVEVVVAHPVRGVFDSMQPTLGKAYRGSMGRFGISIMLDNGKPLCLRDGEYHTVRVLRPLFLDVE